jgi:hypothetical protein
VTASVVMVDHLDLPMTEPLDLAELFTSDVA